MVDCVIAQPISEAGIAILREAGLSVFLSPFSDLDFDARGADHCESCYNEELGLLECCHRGIPISQGDRSSWHRYGCD